MIIKTKIGKSFGGCVNYLTEKDKAEILQAEGVRMDSPQHMTEDFNQVRKINPDLGKAVWHASVSFPEADRGKLTDEMMKNIAQDYANKFGLEQYAVIRHNDAKHEHFHIVANRVKYDGKTVSDKFCASRGAEFSKLLEQKYGLSTAKEKHLDKTNKQALNGHDKAKYEIYEAVKKELPSSRSLEDLKTKLQAKGIEMDIKTQSTGRVYGVSFSKGKESFKGSEIDKTLGANNLSKAIENNLSKAITTGKNIIALGVNQVIDLGKSIIPKIDKGQGFEM